MGVTGFLFFGMKLYGMTYFFGFQKKFTSQMEYKINLIPKIHVESMESKGMQL